jgi:hypothetical protein
METNIAIIEGTHLMPRIIRKPRQTPFVITPVYDILLRGSSATPVGLYHLQIATAEQLTRLHYAKGMLKTIKARLKTLCDHGFLQYDAIPTKFTKSPYYYALDYKGRDYLEDAGLATHEAFRKSKEVNKHSLFIEHTLELNDILIACSLLHKADPSFTFRFLHERVLKRTPYKATWQTTSGQTRKQEIFTLIPDGLLDFLHTLPDGRQQRLTLLLEHDRGSEEQKYFKRRIRAYIVFLQAEGYKTLFQTQKITIAFTTFTGLTRLAAMREWTEQELAATHEPRSIGNTFLFANLQKPLDPQKLLFAPCWYPPYSEIKGQPVTPSALLAE